MGPFDFVVVGSGIAGLSFALKAAELGTVAVFSKESISEANTRYAQGGIASVMDKNDNFSAHEDDTIRAGGFLNHSKVVQVVAEQGPTMIKLLQDWGVDFDTNTGGKFDLGREGGHSKNRIVHVHDFTGRAVQEALVRKAKEDSNIQIFENTMAVDLITDHHLGRYHESNDITCYGVYVLDEKKAVHKVMSKIVMIATGGLGMLYQHTTNPSIATGDGLAMAYRAGAVLSNLEFVQFHPTALYHPSGLRFLISEAVRGYGGHLYNHRGERFMQKYHPELLELAPRDIVARAIDSEMKREGKPYMYLRVSHLNHAEFKKKFPVIYSTCLENGIDVCEQDIPVVPAAHYACGGIATDTNGATNINNLFASGEAAMTGLNGANRLASNSLLEGIVFAIRAFNYIKESGTLEKTSIRLDFPEWDSSGTFDEKEWIYISHDLQEIRQIMWDYVGIVRKTERLNRALNRLNLISKEIEEFYRRTTVSRELIELRNISLLAVLTARSALFRKESRGLHYNLDHPLPKEEWLVDTFIWWGKMLKRSIHDETFQVLKN